MKNRKRIAAVISTAALVCAMSMTALANGNDTVVAEGGTKEITVTNHSNTAVDAEFSYGANPGYDAITAGFYDATKAGSVLSDSKLSLASAEPETGSQTGTAKSGSAYLQITGGALGNSGNSQEIGKITVTIRKAAQP